MQKAEVNPRKDPQRLQKNQTVLLKLILLRKAHLITVMVLQIIQETIIQVLTAILIIILIILIILIIPTTTIEIMVVFSQEVFTLAEATVFL